jgi:hypothetical protein
MVVAEAQAGGQTLEQVAAKHSVTEAALKYHLYKTGRATGRASERCRRGAIRLAARQLS